MAYKNRETLNAYQKKYRGEHKDKCRAAQVKYHYCLTSEQHAQLLEKQNFKCAIEACPAAVNLKSPIDHNHACCPGPKSCGECVRGILCNRHNVGLAHFQDNINELHSAADYLESK